MKNLLIRSLLVLIVGALTTAAQPQDKRPEFEVASVKANTSGNPLIMIRPPVGGLFRATNARVRALVSLAYKVQPFEISGGPGWIDTDGFDIEAKAGDPKVGNDEFFLMLQSLLENRFQLKVRRETHDVPVYELTLPKGPSKLLQPKEGGCTEIDLHKPVSAGVPGQLPPTPCGAFLRAPNHIEGGRVSMTQLAKTLTGILGKPVIDESGFTGTFDVKLDFTPEGAAFRVGPAPDGLPARNFDTDDIKKGTEEHSAPSIFTALQDVLGVKLESAKGPGNMLYIDHVEKPSEN